MNYYEHHIGDYDSATAHLSMLEDAAYSRLLRLYYRTEMPIPADMKEACRRVRASSKPEREAVAAVLSEFFLLGTDGWRNKRCDEDVEKYLAGEPERAAKKANEDNRTKRHREERALLFKALTDAGSHAAWNIGMAELRQLVKSVAGSKTGPPVTLPVTLPVTAPATPVTATQTPDTRHQTPVLNQGAYVEHQQGGPVGPARAEGSGDPGPGSGAGASVLAEVAAMAMRSAGLADVSATHPKLAALMRAGMTVAELQDAATEARKRGHGLPWALARAEGQRQDAAALGSLPDAQPAIDPDSKAAIEADGKRLGLGCWQQIDTAGRMVPWAAYADRVRQARQGAPA